MNVTKSIALVLLLLSATFANAQVQSPVDEKPYIDMTGTAELEITPDEIFVDINISERFDGRDKVTLEQQEALLKQALRDAGIDQKHLSLSAANAIYHKTKKHGTDVLTSKNYKLKLSDAAMVAKLFLELDKIELNDARIASLNHSKIDSIRRTVRISAIKAAKDKADYLLSAIGSKAGKPLVVQEADNYQAEGLNNAGYLTNSTVRYRAPEKAEEDIQLMAIKVRSSIFVKFRIQ